MEVVFIDYAPITHKSGIRSGGHIRRYYAWLTLNKMVTKVIPFRKNNGKINYKAICIMFKKDSKIWVEYGSGRVAHMFVLFAAFIKSKGFTLHVHDFVIQQKYVDAEPPLLKRFTLRIIELLLLKRASVIILACPGLLDYFNPRKNQLIIIMPPGVGEDELINPTSNNLNPKNIALYFGSMQRKGAIPRIIELFSELKNWELNLLGLKEGVNIVDKKNVKYLGSVSHDKLHKILRGANVILIPIPKNEYLDKAMHIKMGYALLSCRPVIATKLKGISEYISMLKLEDNIIYVDEWNLETLKDALSKAQSINIDEERTLQRLRPMAWEPRFVEMMGICLSDCNNFNTGIVWK